jgi:hypothetical protein
MVEFHPTIFQIVLPIAVFGVLQRLVDENTRSSGASALREELLLDLLDGPHETWIQSQATLGNLKHYVDVLCQEDVDPRHLHGEIFREFPTLYSYYLAIAAFLSNTTMRTSERKEQVFDAEPVFALFTSLIQKDAVSFVICTIVHH